MQSMSDLEANHGTYQEQYICSRSGSNEILQLQQQLPLILTLKEWLSSRPEGEHTRRMTPQDKEYWKKDSERYSERYHLEYEIVNDVLTVWMRLPVHRVILNALCKSWYSGNSHLSVDFKDMFELASFEHISYDGKFTKTSKAEIMRTGEFYPRIVFEVGFSETRQSLLNDACRWFQMSQGKCKIVVLVKIEEAREQVGEEEAGEKDAEEEDVEEEDAEEEDVEEEDAEEETVEKEGGEEAREKVEGKDFGPYHSGKKLLIGKCTAYIERWDYTDDFKKRITEANNGPPGHKCNEFIQLIPHDHTSPSTMKFSLEDSPKYESEEPPHFEFSLDKYRYDIKRGLRSSAYVRMNQDVGKTSR